MNSINEAKTDVKRVVIRKVWASNLEYEFLLIRGLIDRYPFISMDTEFPGIIFKPAEPHNHRNLHPSDNYRLIKANVNVLNLIQVGLTLSDAAGNLPDLGTSGCSFIWEFNFRDFNLSHHPHASDSIELLRCQGIDFVRNAAEGIDSARFAQLMMSSGFLCNNAVSWVTFHSAYDFAYLVKILTRQSLPTRMEDFLSIVRMLFGNNIYDIKYLTLFCNGLYGGLERIAQTLHLDRVTGKCHQAGSDSLLTMHAFVKIIETYFRKDGHKKHANVLYGLETQMYCLNEVESLNPLLKPMLPMLLDLPELDQLNER